VHARRAKALRATLSRRPRTIKKRDTRPKRRVSGLLFSLDRETEETPTHRCFSPGGANELSPGAEALEIMPNTRAPQVAIHRSFSPYHPGQPRTTRNLQIAGYPAYDPCLFQPISHPLAIQVSGHEFTRAVRMNKSSSLRRRPALLAFSIRYRVRSRHKCQGTSSLVPSG
jgi:hypothetical protein